MKGIFMANTCGWDAGSGLQKTGALEKLDLSDILPRLRSKKGLA
jgi:hypothetical protein